MDAQCCGMSSYPALSAFPAGLRDKDPTYPLMQVGGACVFKVAVHWGSIVMFIIASIWKRRSPLIPSWFFQLFRERSPTCLLIYLCMSLLPLGCLFPFKGCEWVRSLFGSEAPTWLYTEEGLACSQKGSLNLPPSSAFLVDSPFPFPRSQQAHC